MNQTKILILVLVIVASTGLVFGTFGFTSISAERGVSVQVVDDQHAFVGYQSGDLTVRDGETINLVTVTNQFPNTIDVTDVIIKDGNFTINDLTTPNGISPGSSDMIRGTVDCIPNKTQEIELTVTLTGGGVTAQIRGDTEMRDFTITCAAPDQ